MKRILAGVDPEKAVSCGPLKNPDAGLAVASCTILTPTPVSTTRSTARPSSHNKHDASSLRSITARGSPFAAPEHSEDQVVAGRPPSGALHGSNLRLPDQDRGTCLPVGRP